MKGKIFLIHILTAFTVIFSNKTENEYCKLEICPDESHVMCQYEIHQQADSCTEVKDSTFNFYDRQAAFWAYNKKLEWDHELAIIAQRWAYQCNLTEDECRNTKRFKVRQRTVYLDISFPPEKPERWPPKKYPKGYVHETPPNVILPILQRWAREETELEENRIGCGKIIYRNYSITNDYVQHIVCNFGYEKPKE